VSFLAKSLEGGFVDEDIEVHGGADCLCPQASGNRHSRTRGLPEEQTFYRWKKKYRGLGVSELHRLRQLEEENRRLKRMVADLSLDKQMLQEVLSKKFQGQPRSVTAWSISRRPIG
jgi:putative transposase